MMKNTLKRGFTLIELLVVIAIIGILASVVLASLNSARDKGEDAAWKSSANNMRAQAELFYDDHGGYAGLCTADNLDNDNDANDVASTMDDTIADAVAALNTGDCDSTGAAWAIETALNAADPNDWYCVDSTGHAGTNGATKGATAVVCN